MKQKNVIQPQKPIETQQRVYKAQQRVSYSHPVEQLRPQSGDRAHPVSQGIAGSEDQFSMKRRGAG